MLDNTTVVFTENIIYFYHRSERVFCIDFVDKTKFVNTFIFLKFCLHLKCVFGKMFIICDFQCPK